MIKQPIAPGTLISASSTPQRDASRIGRYRRIRASSGGGFLFSRLVSDRVGTIIAALAEPLNIHPSVLTLGNLALGVAGSALVVLGDGAKAISVTGLVGIILWQLAYALDCADGQLARATGRTSASGARLDTFVDLAVQTSVLVAIASVVEQWSHPPTPLVVILVGTWYVNFIGYLHDRIDAKAVPSLLPSGSALVSVVKLSRDYGFVALVLGVWLTFAPTTLLIPVLGITAVNVATLAGYVAQATLISIRSPAEAQDAGTGEPG